MGGGRIWQKGEGLGHRANWAPSASQSALTGSGPWGWRLCSLELPKPGLFLPFWSPKCHFLREAFPNQLFHSVSCFSSLGASLAALTVKNPPANAGDAGSIPGKGKTPWKRKWQPTPVFLPGKFHGERNLVGYSPRDCKRVRHNSGTKQ